MEPNWKLVYTLNDLGQAELAKQLLEENGIVVVVMNKRDSSYLSFGSVEIYVNEDSEEMARKLLQESGI